jgi:hypothetical protein
MTAVVTVLLAIIGFFAITTWLTKVSKEVWSTERFPTIVTWIVYAVVLGSAYGTFVWEALEPHRWREWLQLLLMTSAMWAVVAAVLLLLVTITYAVALVRGTDEPEGLGLGRPGRTVERLMKHLLARWRAKRDPRGPRERDT